MTATRALLTAALAAASLAAVAAVASDASTTKRAGFTPPARLGAYLRFGDLKINKTGHGQALAKRHDGWNRKTAAALAAAYGGAAAAVQDYSDEGLLNFFLVMAVKGPTPRPVVPYVDAAYLGLARPPDEVRAFGAVSCTVHNNPTVKGHTPAPDAAITVLCQRSGPHLTVQLRNVSGDVGHRPDQVARLTDQVFTAMS